MSEPSGSGEPPAGLLQMGASVSVNDDTRRVIEAETKEVEEICTALASEESKEQLVAMELDKSKKRQGNEIFSMRRGAIEHFESVQMNEECLVQIKGTLQQETRPKVENEDPNSNEPPQTMDHVTAFQEAIVANSERCARMTEFGEEQMRIAQEQKRKVDDIAAEREEKLQKQKEENLRVRLANAKQKTLADEDSLNEETSRVHTLRENHAAVLDRCNELRERIASQKQELVDLTLENASEEAKRKDEIEASQAKKQQGLDEVKALQEQLAAIRNKHGTLTSRLEQGKDLIAKRQKEEARCAEIRAERSATFVAKSEAEGAKLENDKKLKELERTLAEVSTRRQKLESLKEENTKKEAADQEKVDEKAAETENFVKQMESSKTKFENELLALTEELSGVKKSAADDQIKTIALSDESKDAEKSEESLRTEIDQERASFEEKCAEMESKVREEQDTNDAYEEKIKKQIEKNKAVTSADFKESTRCCKVLKIAAKALDGAKKAESALAELESQGTTD